MSMFRESLCHMDDSALLAVTAKNMYTSLIFGQGPLDHSILGVVVQHYIDVLFVKLNCHFGTI